ncbi:MAG: hypothetical protein Q4A36_01240 [Candidatus Saccharibacteria bacterium]|nr:hypothetical protein [Candidatus Saccharibacteria bacterium]
MPKRKRNFRWAKWLILLVLIIIVIVVTILVKNSFSNEKTSDGNKTTTGTTNVDDKKEEKVEQDGESELKKEKVVQYEGESPNKSENLTGLISYTGVSGDKLLIRVNIDQYLQSGTCALTISENNVVYYTQSVAIKESVTTSTCDGFEIPVEKLPTGDLSVEIVLDSNDKSGTITGKARI